MIPSVLVERPEWFRPELGLAALELGRISGVVAVSPIPWSNAPARVRVGLVIFMLAAVHGLGDSDIDGLPSAAWAASNIATEFIIGASIGMVVRLSVAAAEIAGGAIAMPMGFSAAQAFDPTMGSTDSVLTRLFRNLALLLALISGLHRAMLETLVSSFRLLPVGTATHIEATFPIFMDLCAHVVRVGLQLALPLLAVLLMANIALAFVSRAAPTMQIFNVGFAVLLATGAAVLVISLPDLSHELAIGFDRNARYFEWLILEMSGR
ncbi:MAG TPA: flagellar biosynthetic protein FliR [Polyangiaceae bacterium]|nr:flagellar biosynthetic protein FliR [Polyangiaceae bacterium]